MIAGRFAGVTGGIMMSVPALFYGQWIVLPFNALCGAVAGQLRRVVPDKEDIWSFSPFIDRSIYRWIRRHLPTPRLFDWQTMFFLTIMVLRFIQTQMSLHLSNGPFPWMESPKPWVAILIYASSATAIGIELKIWNSVRIQIKLEEQERLLLHARRSIEYPRPHSRVRQGSEARRLAGGVRASAGVLFADRRGTAR